MKITKGQFINYMVDVLGYSEEEARKEFAVYGIKNILTNEQLNECLAFSK